MVSVVEIAKLISPDSDIDPQVTSASGVWCKTTDVSHLVVKLHSLYRCRLVRQTPYAVRCSVARGPRFFKWKMLSVRAVCSATPTSLDCTGDLVAGERFGLL